jgi:HK97 gp10 family phage protein
VSVFSWLGGEMEIFDDAATKMTDNGEARTFMEQLAGEAAKLAEAMAPVDTGTYRDSFSSELDQGGMQAVVSNSDPIWYYLEFGTINNRPFRCLTNATMKIAEKYEDTGARLG